MDPCALQMLFIHFLHRKHKNGRKSKKMSQNEAKYAFFEFAPKHWSTGICLEKTIKDQRVGKDSIESKAV